MIKGNQIIIKILIRGLNAKLYTYIIFCLFRCTVIVFVFLEPERFSRVSRFWVSAFWLWCVGRFPSQSHSSCQWWLQSKNWRKCKISFIIYSNNKSRQAMWLNTKAHIYKRLNNSNSLKVGNPKNAIQKHWLKIVHHVETQLQFIH